jgi:uncharacterized protein
MKPIQITIAQHLSLKEGQVAGTITLLEAGATVPFISRYRKEATGNLDESQIQAVKDEYKRISDLEQRKKVVLQSLEKQEVLSPELRKAVEEAAGMNILEDIYLPYRPKRMTKGRAAREKGLSPLADKIFQQKSFPLEEEASSFIDPEKGVTTSTEAIDGACDIIADRINEDAAIRAAVRRLFQTKSVISSRVSAKKKAEAAKYKDYFHYHEAAATCPSHRILAIFRGEREGFLSCHVHPPDEDAVRVIKNIVVREKNNISRLVEHAAEDAYRRMLKSSMENEMKTALKEAADDTAIEIFTRNARDLLMAPPLGKKPVLALDPGFRTGCKLVCLSATGDLLAHDAVYPLEPHLKAEEAASKISDYLQRYRIEAAAVGNGTGGREAEAFLKASVPRAVPVIMVSENGASVYSASEAAREEFPDCDVTVRGAVSIGRRLQDPLSELVKIDPRSIGVGQYQHDVDQKKLKAALDDTVISCVNAVGVELNTAGVKLLQYVSGLNSSHARALTAHREQNGPFNDRRELLTVKGIGEKIFEQAAGFLKIRGAADPLDETAVHPESYLIVEKMAVDLGCTVKDLLKDPELRRNIDAADYVGDEAGLPTILTILEELEKPGRDPRAEFETFSFSDTVHDIEDLEEGMILPGIVGNITAFGAFIDIGVHQDGLAHISELSDEYVRDPHHVLKLNQKVLVRILSVDVERKRIALSLKNIRS